MDSCRFWTQFPGLIIRVLLETACTATSQIVHFPKRFCCTKVHLLYLPQILNTITCFVPATVPNLDFGSVGSHGDVWANVCIPTTYTVLGFAAFCKFAFSQSLGFSRDSPANSQEGCPIGDFLTLAEFPSLVPSLEQLQIARHRIVCTQFVRTRNWRLLDSIRRQTLWNPQLAKRFQVWWILCTSSHFGKEKYDTSKLLCQCGNSQFMEMVCTFW